MSIFNQTMTLLRKEVQLEIKRAYSFGGLLLYVLSTLYIIYISFARIEGPQWIILYWIIVLFTAVNAILKSFTQDGANRNLYYFTAVSGTAVLLSKIIYNFLLLSFLSLLNFWVFGLISGNPIQNTSLFVTAILLGSLGFSIGLTLVAAIAAQLKQNATMMAILGFPVVIPILLSLMHMSAYAVQSGSAKEEVMGDVLALAGIDAILFAISLILFPFLWKD